MVNWAKENAKSSGMENAPIRWIVDDCAKFVEREIRRGRRYDAVIMDPPSYGRGPSGEIWKLEENLFAFLELVTGVLSENPLFFLVNSYTTGLAPSVLTYLLETLITKKHGGHTNSEELGLLVAETGLMLPCGATGRWTASAR
ncbi:MAG: SAM-dependent methyltransferase, partial [Evtepia sp.]|jgi:23S rRNA (cytosine1962-C5)-methyltransferase|nr:SAM-dependent methyltransferase [Evtepia sp.]